MEHNIQQIMSGDKADDAKLNKLQARWSRLAWRDGGFQHIGVSNFSDP